MVLAALLVGRSRGVAGQSRSLPARPWSWALGSWPARSRALLGHAHPPLRLRVPHPRCSASPAAVLEWLDPLERALNKLVVYAPPLVLRLLAAAPPAHARDWPWPACSWWRGSSTRETASRSARRGASSASLRITRDRDRDGLHGAAPRHHAARTAEPRAQAPRRAALLLPPRGPDRADLRRARPARHAPPNRGDRPWHGHPGRLRPARATRSRSTRSTRWCATIALDRAYFTYRERCPRRGASTVRVELGDARVRLERVRRERPDERYDLIVVDAFTSDAIPVHLLTRRSPAALSRDADAASAARPAHLEPLSATSSRWWPILPKMPASADGCSSTTRRRRTQGRHPIHVGGAGPDPEALGELALDARWTATPLEVDPRVGVWTDDFHNLLSCSSGVTR